MLTVPYLVDAWILEKLQTRANGNFLFARLIVERLEYGVFNIDGIKDLVTSILPNNVAEMYRRIFCKYQEDQHKYIRYGGMLYLGKISQEDMLTPSQFAFLPCCLRAQALRFA